MSSSNDVGDGSGSSSLSTFFQRYHDVQKTDVAVNQLNIKVRITRMDTGQYTIHLKLIITLVFISFFLGLLG